MKTTIYLGIFILLLGCNNPTASDPPKKLLTPAQMEDILFDLSIMQSINSSSFVVQEASWVFNHAYLYKKHKIDSTTWADNYKFYSENPKTLVKIYERLDLRLDAMSDSIDQIIKKQKLD